MYIKKSLNIKQSSSGSIFNTQSSGYQTPHTRSINQNNEHLQQKSSSKISDIELVTPLQQLQNNQQNNSYQCSPSYMNSPAKFNPDKQHINKSIQIAQQTRNILNDVVKICDGIYIGMGSCVQDLDLFHSNYITHIVTLTAKDSSTNFIISDKLSTVRHILGYELTQNIENDPESIRSKKNQLVNFIQGAKLSGESVLIFTPIQQKKFNIYQVLKDFMCSAIVATEYLMLRYCWSLFKALQFVNCRISAAYRTINILKQLKKSDQPQFIPPIVEIHPHLKQTQILLLKSDRNVSYNWQKQNQNLENVQQTVLQNTFLNSGKGKGIFMTYQQIINTERQRSIKTSRKCSPKTNNNYIYEKDSVHQLIKNKLKTTNSKSQYSLRNRTSQNNMKIQKNNSISLMRKCQNSQISLKNRQISLKSILKENKPNRNTSQASEYLQIQQITERYNKQNSTTNIKKGNYSLQLNLKKNAKTSRNISRKNSQDSKNKQKNKQDIDHNTINKHKKRVKWCQQVIVCPKIIQNQTFNNNQVYKVSPPSDSKQKIILSVMQLVGKKYLQKQTSRHNIANNKNKLMNRVLNKQHKLVKSKIKLETIKDFTNNGSLNSDHTIIKNHVQKQANLQQTPATIKKMVTMPDMLEYQQVKQNYGINNNHNNDSYSGLQTYNTSMLCSIKTNSHEQQPISVYNHEDHYSKTQNNTQDYNYKQNLVALTIQQLKKLKESPGSKLLKTKNKIKNDINHNILKSAKSKRNLKIMI